MKISQSLFFGRNTATNNQGFFLGFGIGFDQIFLFASGYFVFDTFCPYEFYWSTTLGIFGSGAGIVVIEDAFGEIIGDAGVEGIVLATEDVDVSHSSIKDKSFLFGHRLCF